MPLKRWKERIALAMVVVKVVFLMTLLRKHLKYHDDHHNYGSHKPWDRWKNP